LEDRIRNLENFALVSVEIHRLMEESQRRMEESQRRMEASQRQMEESQRQRDEVMERMAHAIALIQADIVRIDETR
jgi:hypothetical protein